jgi:uncharacterized protein (TIGR02271 family)
MRRYSVDREDRGDRFAKDEDRKHSEEGRERDSSSRGRQRDRHDQETIRVPKKREEAHVERIPAEEGGAPEEVEVRDDEVLIPVIEEEVVVEKRPVVKEVLRVRKEVVEEEEAVGADVHEEDKDKHSYLNEHARRGSGERDRRATPGREEEHGEEEYRGRGDRDRGPRRRGDRERGEPSFIDKAKDALSGQDTRREESRGRETRRGPREDEPPTRR